jgi:hypothetical protein
MMNSSHISRVQISEHTGLDERLQELQAQLAALTLLIASRDGSGIVPSSTASVDGPGPAAAHRGPNITEAEATCESVATPSEVMTFHEQPLIADTSMQGPQSSLTLGNGTTLCFSKQSVPYPPSMTFSKDIPLLMRIWDDSSAEWSPAEAVLHIQGQPIALKDWHDVYSYGKAGHWAHTKKTWTNWRVSFCPIFFL